MLACRSTSTGLLSRKLRWKRDTGVAAEFDPGHRGIKAAFDETKRDNKTSIGVAILDHKELAFVPR